MCISREEIRRFNFFNPDVLLHAGADETLALVREVRGVLAVVAGLDPAAAVPRDTVVRLATLTDRHLAVVESFFVEIERVRDRFHCDPPPGLPQASRGAVVRLDPKKKGARRGRQVA